jgi:hypothetical protein
MHSQATVLSANHWGLTLGDDYAYALTGAVESGLKSRQDISDCQVQVRMTEFFRGLSPGLQY